MNIATSTTASRLQQEFTRLFLVTGHDGESLINHVGLVRSLVLEVKAHLGWKALSRVWYGVQSDFELPAPAIAVSGIDGIQLWFSFADTMDSASADQFLTALTLRYLDTVPPASLRTFPSSDGARPAERMHAKLVPGDPDNIGHWSAFVSADLAAIFDDEPWLDVPPNRDQQADILAKLHPIKREQLSNLFVLYESSSVGMTGGKAEPSRDMAESSHGNIFTASADVATMSPHEFLLQVMRDTSLPLRDRLEAAKALLPYIK